jgi:hypothetical protein
VPRLSVWFIRTALIYLALGFTFGALILLHKGAPFAPEVWRLLPLHIESLLMGWTAQLALGVAYWILPRFLHGPPRGDERPAWLAYGLLNLGVAGVMGASGASLGLAPTFTAPAWLALVARLAEAAALVLFAVHVWPRIKTFGV